MNFRRAFSFTALIGLALAHLPMPKAWAAENLLSPIDSPASKAGSSILPPWNSSDGSDDGKVSVRLGSPIKGESDWVELRDQSLTHTANIRFGAIPPLSKGSFSYEICIPKETRSIVQVSLGQKAVADSESRIITWKFLPGGRIQISTNDEEQEASYRYTHGKAEIFRCDFDLESSGSATVTFYSQSAADPFAQILRPVPLPRIDGVRITSTQKGSDLHWFIRNLSLNKH